MLVLRSPHRERGRIKRRNADLPYSEAIDGLVRRAAQTSADVWGTRSGPNGSDASRPVRKRLFEAFVAGEPCWASPRSQRINIAFGGTLPRHSHDPPGRASIATSARQRVPRLASCPTALAGCIRPRQRPDQHQPPPGGEETGRGSTRGYAVPTTSSRRQLARLRARVRRPVASGVQPAGEGAEQATARRSSLNLDAAASARRRRHEDLQPGTGAVPPDVPADNAKAVGEYERRAPRSALGRAADRAPPATIQAFRAELSRGDDLARHAGRGVGKPPARRAMRSRTDRLVGISPGDIGRACATSACSKPRAKLEERI